MADPYDYTGRDGRGNDKLWHEEDEDMDEESLSYDFDPNYDDRDELDKPYWMGEDEDEPEYDDMMSTYDDQTELED
jgi:hypothetical protein